MHITLGNLDAVLRTDLKKITKNNKTNLYISKMNLNFNIKTVHYEFDEKEKELINLRKIINDNISNHREEIIGKVKSVLETEISKRIISVFNIILCDRFEELFPEQT